MVVVVRRVPWWGLVSSAAAPVLLVGVGACHVITGLALRPAASAGRLILMSAGAATMLVAAFPETAGVLLGLLAWFGTELAGGGRQVGLAERVLAGAEAVWPLAVVLACRWSQSRTRDADRAGWAHGK